eukprot:TRINITY_DN3588_c0_g1_i1.p1 TRINITY_DN3588_c0_g1~~TRINITY_DN3588_c0_g1_i1.p1  ORF type:complete len:729 (-),score=146.96 TRINITY_DN3588_c0_g1_i1:2410-4596(-)
MSHARTPLEREAEILALLKSRAAATSTPKGSTAGKSAPNENVPKYFQHSTPKGGSSQKPAEKPKRVEIPGTIFYNSPRYAGLNGLPPKFQFFEEKRPSVPRPPSSKPFPGRTNGITVAEATALSQVSNMRASPKADAYTKAPFHVESGGKGKQKGKDSFEVSTSNEGRKILSASTQTKGKGTPGQSEEKTSKKAAGYLTSGIVSSSFKPDAKRPVSATNGSQMAASLTKILGQVPKGTKGSREEPSGLEDESTLQKIFNKKGGSESNSMYSTVGARPQTSQVRPSSKHETPKNGAAKANGSAKRKSPKPQKLQISIETGEITTLAMPDRKSLEGTAQSKGTGPTPKGNLQNFITKVNKGDIFSVNLNLNPGGRVDSREAERSLSKKGKGAEEQLLTRTPKSGGNSPQIMGTTYAKYPKTTTNQDSKSFAFNGPSNRSNGTPLQKKVTKPPTPTSKPSSKAETAAPSQEKVEYYMTHLERYNRNPRDGDYFNQLYREHFIQTYQAMTFCKMLKQVDPRVLQAKRCILPKRDGYKDKRTIVFDLDETLIHCNESTDIPSDAIVPIKFPHGEIIEAGINIRPFAIEMLSVLSKSFEIIVFTASHGCYANVVLDYLDPNGEMIHHRLFREHCVQTEEGIYIKDLRVLANRDLKDTVIVDNAAYSFGYQLENGIPIVPFYDNKHDVELKYLTEYLLQMAVTRDVRELNSRTFRLSLYQECESPDTLLDELFPR